MSEKSSTFAPAFEKLTPFTHKEFIMKKVLFALAALVMAFSFTGCKEGTAKVIVSVTDLENQPIEGRKVYYTDLASVIIGAVLPDPNAPLEEDNEEHLSYGKTNAQGTVTFEYSLIGDLIYYFYVYDEGSNQWKDDQVTLKKGYVKEINFKVNK